MAEDTEKPSSGQNKSEEKKPQTPTPQPPSSGVGARIVFPVPGGAPMQAASSAPRPPAPPPIPLPKAVPPKTFGRRNFVRLLVTLGAVLSIVPFVPWGSYLTSSVSSGGGKKPLLQKVVVDNLSKFGAAAGQVVNVNDLSTFPANSHWIITYPTSGSNTVDTQNPDTFLKYELVRLPRSLGGDSKKATDFVAFSKVCVHLWCSPNYNPTSGHQQYECPCHGSIYRVPDGKAVDGPASFQPAPTNAIPMLTLQADANGNLYIFTPNRDPDHNGDPVTDSIAANGELGYGRDFNSYASFIKPRGEEAANLQFLQEEA